MSKSFKNMQKSRALRDLIIIFIPTLMFISAGILGLHEGSVRWAQKLGETFIQIEAITIVLAILAVSFGIFSLRRWRELRVEINEHEQAKQEIFRRNRELSMLYTIDHAASQSLNLEEILNDALEATLNVLEIEGGGIYLFETDGEMLTFRVHRGVSDEFVKNVQYIKLGEGISGRVVAEKRPVVLDVSEYPTGRLAPFIVQEGIKTLASIPLLSGGGELVGAMNLVMRRPHTFSQEEYQLLVAVGQQLGGIVKKAQLHEKVKQELIERKQAEEALRTERERLETVTQNMGAGLAIISKDYKTQWANKVLKQLFGETEGKICHTTYNQQSDICPGCGVREIFETGKDEVIHEQSGKDIQGNTVWSEIIATPIRDEKGNITAALELIVPITERKQVEEELRKTQDRLNFLISASPAVIYTCEPLLPYAATFITENIKKQLGYEPKDFIEDPNFWADNIHPEDAQRIFNELPNLFEKGHHIHEYRFRHKNGTYGWMYDEMNLIKDEKGNPIEILGLWIDITERKKTEEKIVTLQEQLYQSQKMEAIGRMAGGIAHDFNNLLTIIKGYSQLSAMELKEGDLLKGNIEEIQRATDRAATLTRQLLAFSRRQIMEMKVLDLNTIVKDLDKMLSRIIGEDIELVMILAEDLGRVKTDPGQIEQVIMNLVVNARDAMPNGGKLTIETANVELDEEYARAHIAAKPSRYVRLSISDTGVGMTPEVKEKVFEPFFTTKEKSKGTGLGLSTVYGIVKQSDGNIWVYSEPGKGTTFKIYLPRVDEPLEELKEKLEPKDSPRGNETIVVVEDNEKVRKLAVKILNKQGYKVFETSDGNKVIEIYEKHEEPIHLVLTDVVMPGMSGRELTNRLKQIHPEIKVLYMSGYTDNTIVHHGVLDEGVNYIQKPFTVDGLARKVREVLDI